MKLPHIILFLVYISTRYAFGAVFVPPPAATVSDETMLTAIADVETGNNAAKRGHHGERTQLQIMPATWREYSHLPHSVAASHPEETDRVARAYLSVIRSRLRDRGLPETPFFIAAGWNAGAGWKRLHRSTVSYAERVSNVAEALQHTPALALQPAPTPVPILIEPAAAPRPTLALKNALAHRSVIVARVDDVPAIRIAASN